MTRRVVLAVMLVALGAVVVRRCSPSGESPRASLPGAGPAGAVPDPPSLPQNRSGLEYATPGSESLTLDIKYPSSPGPHPVVLLPPHYGNWKAEDLERDTRYRVVLAALLGRGYAVVVPHYRPLGAHRFPAQIEDGKALIQWLRTNGSRMGLATDRIGAVGASVAGYGVSLLGTIGPGDGFGPPGADPKASRLQAVVALGAPVDLVGRKWSFVEERLYGLAFFGKLFDEDPKLYARASPGTYATPDDPPFLLIHAAKDPFVPVSHSRAFASQLRRAGVAVELVEEDTADHVWGGERLDRTMDRVTTFLDRHLRK